MTTMSCTIRPLDASTWDAFAELVERNNGIFGGEASRPGIARAALEGALDEIAHAGGGGVEAISEVIAGREAPGRFLSPVTAPGGGRPASRPPGRRPRSRR